MTVDDTVLFLARFSGGAVASFEAARQATGNQNRNGFEINGTKGSVKFDFERMNELQYYDATLPRAVQGWTTIMCTHGGDHPYVANWWPDAHIIGYEHGFTNQAYDILRVLAGEEPTLPIPDFNDAYQTQRVLEAALIRPRKKTPRPPGGSEITALVPSMAGMARGVDFCGPPPSPRGPQVVRRGEERHVQKDSARGARCFEAGKGAVPQRGPIGGKTCGGGLPCGPQRG